MKTKGMNFTEAVQAAQVGKKIRRAGWDNIRYAIKNVHGGRHLQFVYRDGNTGLLMSVIEDALATDWEIIDEQMPDQSQPIELPETLPLHESRNDKKTTGLTFPEALQAAIDGSKMRRAVWQEDEEAKETYLMLDDRSGLVDQNGERYFSEYLPTYRLASMLADDWEVMPEEKPLPQTIPFREAVLAVLDGKKVKRLSEPWTYSLAASDSNLIMHSVNIKVNDWIIVGE